MGLLIPSGANGNSFDAIRLSMALLVVWSHSYAIHRGDESAEWIYRLTNGTVTAGTVAVMAFFIISGFLITQSFERSGSLGSYLEKRIRRIYPGYIAATSICAFIIVPAFASHSDLGAVKAAKIIAHNLLLQNAFPISDAFAGNPYPRVVNGSLWSIPLEFGCYLVVAALGIVRLASNRLLLLCSTAAALATRVALDLAGVQPHVHIAGAILLWGQVLPSFLLGMAALAYREHLPRSRVLLLGLIAAALTSCWISRYVGELVLAPALAYAVFYAAYGLPSKAAAKYGDFSYGCYLYAFAIQQSLEAQFGRQLALPAFIVLSIGLSLLAGVFSWHLVERWFLKRTKTRQKIIPVQPLFASGCANALGED